LRIAALAERGLTAKRGVVLRGLPDPKLMLGQLEMSCAVKELLLLPHLLIHEVLLVEVELGILSFRSAVQITCI
jgi:hypothetical protein